METPKNLLQNQKVVQLPKQSDPVNYGNVSKQPPETPKSKKNIVAIVIIIIAILLSVWFIAYNKKKAVPAENNSELGSSETAKNGELGNSVLGVQKRLVAEPVSVSGSNDVAANDQKAGDKVEVTMVTLSVPGWVAIHEDRDGGLGNVLGASRYDPGIHLGKVELLRGTVSGGFYHAVLYQDNGDRQFDMSTDAPIKNAEGKIIEATFKTE